MLTWINGDWLVLAGGITETGNHSVESEGAERFDVIMNSRGLKRTKLVANQVQGWLVDLRQA